jgi:hypothetical protein
VAILASGEANFYWPPRFGVNPGISETATREDERMQLVFIRDRKVQIAIDQNFVNGPLSLFACLRWHEQESDRRCATAP